MTFPVSKITEGRRVTVKRTGLGDGRQRHGSEPRVRKEQCALVCRSHVVIGSQRPSHQFDGRRPPETHTFLPLMF